MPCARELSKSFIHLLFLVARKPPIYHYIDFAIDKDKKSEIMYQTDELTKLYSECRKGFLSCYNKTLFQHSISFKQEGSSGIRALRQYRIEHQPVPIC